MIKNDLNSTNINVHQNWFNITDKKELNECEILFSGLRIKELIKTPLKGTINFQYLKEVHKYIYQDIYPDWAGQTRTVEIKKPEAALNGKSINYTDSKAIDEMASKAFEKLEQKNGFRDLTQTEFTKELSSLMTDMWAVNPFKEGSTQALMIVSHQISEQAGYSMSVPLIDKLSKSINTALTQSTANIENNLKQVLEQTMKKDLTVKKEMSYPRLALSVLLSTVIVKLTDLFNHSLL